MASIAVNRIRRDLRDIIKSETATPCGIKVELIDDSVFELRGEIAGPPDSPYEGGKFELAIKIPSLYPIQPPEIWFLTKVWHANISSTAGDVCLDILRKEWSASLTLRTILLSLQVLLSTPEPNDPQDMVVARQLKENPEMFRLTARYWTNVYAGGPSKNQSFDDKVRKVMESGMCANDSLALLSSCDWDLEYAINELASTRSDCANSTPYHCEDDQNEYDLSEDDSSEYDQSEDDQSEDDQSEDDQSEDDQSEEDQSEEDQSDEDQSEVDESKDDQSEDVQSDDD